MKWQMWNVKERQHPSKIWTFPVVWYVCQNFSPRYRQWEHKWQHLSISEQTSNESCKDTWGDVQVTQSSMGAWHWTEKLRVSTQLERVVWEQLLIACYSLREWHGDYPFLQYKATKAGDFLYPVTSD